jgi:hypothetical protein
MVVANQQYRGGRTLTLLNRSDWAEIIFSGQRKASLFDDLSVNLLTEVLSNRARRFQMVRSECVRVPPVFHPPQRCGPILRPPSGGKDLSCRILPRRRFRCMCPVARRGEFSTNSGRDFSEHGRHPGYQAVPGIAPASISKCRAFPQASATGIFVLASTIIDMSVTCCTSAGRSGGIS